MRLEDLFCNHVKPEGSLVLEELLQEVTAAYKGHLKAESEKYRCDINALDSVYGGAEHFMHITSNFYKYAVEGHLLTTGIAIQDDNWLDFGSFINQARWDDEFHGTNSLALNLEKLFKMGAVRARLDIDTLGESAERALPTVLQDGACGYLTLFEVAVLAQMTEKAVRNATQPLVPDRLITHKKGSSTVVASTEALRWLKKRRNFTPTVLA